MNEDNIRHVNAQVLSAGLVCLLLRLWLVLGRTGTTVAKHRVQSYVAHIHIYIYIQVCLHALALDTFNCPSSKVVAKKLSVLKIRGLKKLVGTKSTQRLLHYWSAKKELELLVPVRKET